MLALVTFLRSRFTDIVTAWETKARGLPSARKLSRERLIDFVPGVLDRIASHVERLTAGHEGPIEEDAAKKHARDRLADDYSLGEMIEELSMLRSTILELWRGRDAGWILNRVIDCAIMAAVLEFTTLRERERNFARASLEKSEARLRFLAKAETLLSSTLDLQATLDHAATMLVPDFADWCAVDLIHPDGSARELAAVAHVDPEKVPLVKQLGCRFSDRPSRLVENVDSEWLEENVPDRAERDAVLRLGVRSFLLAPLQTRDITFGTILVAQSDSGRNFTADDQAFIEELTRRAAAAVDNARLFDETRRAVELRDRILAVVSHDLRNPLGAIDLGAALLLKNTTIRSDPISRKQAETIQRAAGRMDRLIADLLDMSSIQAGRLSLRRDACRLEPLLSEAVDAYEPSALEKGIQVGRDIRLQDAVVVCDHDRILQVLSNLLGNAIKFCKSGDNVTIKAEMNRNEAVVMVSDTGPGIVNEELERVFELYWQGTAREQRGTGLGLFIARGIVEAHGGRLWVKSTPGRGSTFFLALPLAE